MTVLVVLALFCKIAPKLDSHNKSINKAINGDRRYSQDQGNCSNYFANKWLKGRAIGLGDPFGSVVNGTALPSQTSKLRSWRGLGDRKLQNRIGQRPGKSLLEQGSLGHPCDGEVRVWSPCHALINSGGRMLELASSISAENNGEDWSKAVVY